VNKTDKAGVVDKLVEEFQECPTFFVADYRGLDVPGISALRDSLRPLDANFRVVKNTLAKIAAERAGYDDVAELFAGPSAVAFVRGDAAAIAKALVEAGKVTPDTLELRGGLMDGSLVGGDQVKDIAKLPPREVILAMLVGAVNGPMQFMVGAVNAPVRDIVQVLDAYIQKREAEEAA
jgi:large subunit ribosomal protein L10